MIKQFFKKVLISYLIIICCIYTPTAQAAGWSFGGFNFGNGSLNITKNGVKITTAAVDSAPITSNLGKKILGGAIRGASVLNAISIIAGLGSDAIDWVLDPANNAIKYKASTNSSTSSYMWAYSSSDGSTKYCYTESQCSSAISASSPNWDKAVCKLTSTQEMNCLLTKNGSFVNRADLYRLASNANEYKTIPIPTVANKIYDMAKSGDTNAQADVTSAVSDLVTAGTYDTPINQAIQQAIDNGTLPKDDTNTDTNNPTNPNTQIDTSSITAAIKSLASSFAKSLADNFNATTSVINTSIDKLLNKQDQIQGELVNTGSKIDSVGGKVVGVGDKVDNVGGKVVGVGDAVKDVGGKVVGLNDSVDKVGDAVVGVGDKVTTTGDKVTDAVTGVGDKVGTKVDSVGEKVTTVGDKVGTKVDSVGEKVTTVGDKVTGVGDKVDAVGEKVDAAGEKTAEAIKESTKEITKKMDETKPKDFELPAFCSWASKVCDFIDWVKKDPDLLPDDNTPLVKDEKDSSFVDEYANKSYVNFSGQCPAPPVFNIFGGQITFPMEIVCKACEQMSWVFISFAWLRAVMIVFFASKG